MNDSLAIADSVRLHRRGIARGDIGGWLFVILILSSVGIVVFAHTRERVGDEHCRWNLANIVSAWELYAQGSQNRTPLTGGLSVDDQTIAPSTANLHSIMIFNNYYVPETTVCPNEQSPFVQIKSDFDYEANKNSSDLPFDPTFDCDITGNNCVSNVSYANLAPRIAETRLWSSDRPNQFPELLIGDRGPKDGRHDPHSISYRNHGTMAWWRGFLGARNGSVLEFEENRDPERAFTPDRLLERPNNPQDNIFRDDRLPSDLQVWLGVFITNPNNQQNVIPIWD